MQSERERTLSQLIIRALDAIRSGRYAFAAEAHVEKDMAEFGLHNRDEYLDLVYECLQCAACDPVGCYRPPIDDVSTMHPLTLNMPMSAFEVSHESYPEKIYFKFCLKEFPDGTYYLHIDCHGSRPKQNRAY